MPNKYEFTVKVEVYGVARSLFLKDAVNKVVQETAGQYAESISITEPTKVQ